MFLQPAFFLAVTIFFSGALIQEELQELIEEANAPEVDIYISPDANTGTATPSGIVTHKVGKSFPVIFTEAENYQFKYWEVIDRTTQEIVEDAISISNKYDMETRFTVKANVSNLVIHPVCVERPAVSNHSPQYSESGVPRDSSIAITFTKPIAKDNDFSKISITSGGDSITEFFKAPVINENILIFTPDPLNLLKVNTDTKSITVKVPSNFYYLDGDTKVEIGSEYTWTYKVNNTTNDKAEISFSVPAENGTISPVGDQKYNIGESFTLKFEPNEYYSFNGWTALDGDGKDISTSMLEFSDRTSMSTKVTVLGKISGGSITPKSVKLPSVTKIIPTYDAAGKEQDSDIVITFNTPVKAADFDKTFNNINITAGGLNLLSSDNCYFELPRLSSDGKQLLIRTVKTKRIIPSESTMTYQNVSVKLNLANLTDAANVPFGNDFSYEYKVNRNVDSVIPELKDFKVFKTKNADGTYSDELTLSDIETWTENQFKQNHLKDKIYVYIKARDEGDGIYRARIKEEQLYYSMGEASNYKTDYKIVNSDFRELDDYCYETYFEYTLTPTYDGIEKVDISFFDYAEHPVNLQSFYVIKDTENSTVMWKVNNYSEDKPIDVGYDRTSTRIYWSNIEDIYATYNGVTYKTSIEDMKVSFAYGNNKDSLHKKDLSSSDIQYGDYNSTYRGSYLINYEDITKETFIEFTVTDEAGNAGTKLYAIPPMRNFYSSYYELKHGSDNSYPWYNYITDPVNSEIENVTVRYISYDAVENKILNNVTVADEKPVVSDANSGRHTQYLQIRYEFNDNGNISKFYAPWGTAYSHRSFDLSQAPEVPDFEGKFDDKKPLVGSKFYWRISFPVTSYHSDYKYLIVSGGSSGIHDVHQLMDFVQEDNEMVCYLYSQVRTFDIYVMDDTKCSKPVTVTCSGGPSLASDREGPEFGYDDSYYSASGGFIFDYCNDESGYKPYEKDERYTKVEYFYIPYLPIYKYSPLNLTEAQMDTYKKTVMLSPVTEESEWLSCGAILYQFDFETKDFVPGELYSLYVKAYDSVNNCTYGPIDYVLCLWPLKEKLSYVYEGTTLTVSIKEEMNTTDYNVIWEEFDDTNQWWKQNRNVDTPEDYECTSWVNMDGPVGGLYNVSVTVPKDKFVRYCVKAHNEPFFQSLQLQVSNMVHTTTATSYLYTSPVKCNVKNIMTGVAGTTVFCDQPCLYYICTSDVGYGRDVEKWERYGARVGYTQVSSSSNVDDSLVQPGDKYVVIAHFADNTTLMSEVMEK